MAHLPAPSVSIALITTFFAVQRDSHTPLYCQRVLIGPLRRRLEAFQPRANAMDVLHKNVPAGSFGEATMEARSVLAFHCKVCGKCKLSKEPP